MIPSETSLVGTQLDEDHAPETNGRMSICRRCGSDTDGPAGLHHVPHERQLARSSGWLVSEAQRRRIKLARDGHRR
jgi:hypothetical protein